jgi:hypothetical protein
MTKTPADGMVELARMAGSFVEAVVEQEALVLHTLQGATEAAAKLTQKPVSPLKQDAETEAGFDNMPV